MTESFHVPEVRSETADKLGHAYARLYDEDESMMIGRHAALDAAHEVPVRVVEVDGEQYAFRARCPHLRGPLDDAAVVDGVVQCPWHGYRFDVRTGVNLDGHPCRLGFVPVNAVGELQTHARTTGRGPWPLPS